MMLNGLPLLLLVWNYLSRGDTTSSEPGSSPLINYQENAPTEIPVDQSDGSSSLIEVLSSLVSLVCVKLRKTNWHTMEVSLSPKRLPKCSQCGVIPE